MISFLWSFWSNWNQRNFSYHVSVFELLIFLPSSTYSFGLDAVVMPSHVLYSAILGLSDTTGSCLLIVVFRIILSEPLACDIAHTALIPMDQWTLFLHIYLKEKSPQGKKPEARHFWKNQLNLLKHFLLHKLWTNLNLSNSYSVSSVIRQIYTVDICRE